MARTEGDLAGYYFEFLQETCKKKINHCMSILTGLVKIFLQYET